MSKRYAEGQQFENPRPGVHVARCYKVIDMGTQRSVFSGEERFKRKVAISWELPLTLMVGTYTPEAKGKPFSVTKRYTQSLHAKSVLRADLEAWRGKMFDKESLEQFDDRKLIGLTCLLTLQEDETGQYMNVVAIAPCKDHTGAKIAVPAAVNKPVYLSLEPDEFDQATFDALHEKQREKIMASPEYKRLTEPAAPDDDGPPPGEVQPDAAGDSDIPF